MNETSKDYYSLTCPICVFKIGSSCRGREDCCIIRMKGRRKFDSVLQVIEFGQNCFYFIYERSYLYFYMEGNLFENSQQHFMRYFDFID